MTRIACFGEAMIELSSVGETTQLGVAGDTLNTAIYMRRSAPEITVDYVTALGDDPYSARIHEFITAQNVGASAIRQIEGVSPGLYAIDTAPDGERSFTYWRSASAARQMFDDGDFSALESYDALYLSGISLAILPHSVRLSMLQWLAKTPIKVIYDSNYRHRLWDSVENARAITKQMWARADIALPSIDDEMELFEESAAQVEARFAAFDGIGALKRGPSGPLSLGELVTQTYPPAANVLDTTAAGDSFNGGYLAAYLSGKGQQSALMAGHQLAAEVVQHRGAIMPISTP